jgi:hypothetical protein
MKFPSQRVELDPQKFGTTNAGETLWMDLPVTVKELFVKQLRSVGDDPGNVKANGLILSLVSAWNLDDEAGTVLPLFRDIDRKKWAEAFDGLPVGLAGYIARTVVGTMTEGILGNSKTSSEPSSPAE